MQILPFQTHKQLRNGCGQFLAGVFAGRGILLQAGKPSMWATIPNTLHYIPPRTGQTAIRPPLKPTGSLNHIALIVDDLEQTDAAITANGFKTFSHDDYDPGRRFYFYDDDNIEYEVVQYD